MCLSPLILFSLNKLPFFSSQCVVGYFSGTSKKVILAQFSFVSGGGGGMVKNIKIFAYLR